MTASVTYTRTELVSTVVMDDGKVNVCTMPMLRSLHEALDQAERDETVVLLKGRPGCFTAGFDLRTLSGLRQDVLTLLSLGHHWPSASCPSPYRSPSPALATRSPPVHSS
jgi:enoyl-CoA hydratase